MLIAIVKRESAWQSKVGLGLLVLLAAFALGWMTFILLPGVPYAGGDFRGFYSSGELMVQGRTADIYRLDVQREVQRPFLEAIGSAVPVDEAAVMPMPFFASFVPLFVPFALLPPVVAYYGWLVFSILLFVLGLFWLSRAFGIAFWKLLLLSTGFIPLAQGLVVGQVHAILFLGMIGFYVSLREDQETSAGLWLSTLLLKPQYLPLLLIVMLCHRKWRLLLSFVMVALAAVIGTGLLVGLEGIRAYFSLLTGYAGAEGLVTNALKGMVNWRALSLLLLQNRGALLIGTTVVLSIVYAALALLPWRGARWERIPVGEWDVLMLSLLAATLITAYHSHTHALVLMLVPAIALLASLNGEERLRDGAAIRWLPDVVVFGPSLAVLGWSVFLAPRGVPETVTNLAMLGILAFAVVFVALRFSVRRASENVAPAST